jgi:hypothetical protein
MGYAVSSSVFENKFDGSANGTRRVPSIFCQGITSKELCCYAAVRECGRTAQQGCGFARAGSLSRKKGYGP